MSERTATFECNHKRDLWRKANNCCCWIYHSHILWSVNCSNYHTNNRQKQSTYHSSICGNLVVWSSSSSLNNIFWSFHTDIHYLPDKSKHPSTRGFLDLTETLCSLHFCYTVHLPAVTEKKKDEKNHLLSKSLWSSKNTATVTVSVTKNGLFFFYHVIKIWAFTYSSKSCTQVNYSEKKKKIWCLRTAKNRKQWNCNGRYGAVVPEDNFLQLDRSKAFLRQCFVVVIRPNV